MDLHAALLQSIERISGVPAEQVRPHSGLDDLGIDSLSIAELITDLEIRLGAELPIDVLRRLNRLRTVGEVEEQLRGVLDESGSPG